MNMSAKEDYAVNMLKAHDQLKAAFETLKDACGNTYTVTNVLNGFIDMFDRFCPYKVGDRVRLVKSFTTDDPNHGWRSSAHFLHAGATAVIAERSYCHEKHCFFFLIRPEFQSWISGIDGSENTLSEKEHAHYGFSEGWLSKA